MCRGKVLAGSLTSLTALWCGHTHTHTQIEDGEIHATLDQAAGMVSFTENPQNFDSLGTVRYLDTQLKEAISLEKKLGSFERELAGDPRYIQRVSENT